MYKLIIRAWHLVNKVMYEPKDVPVLAKNLSDDSLWIYMLSTGIFDKNGIMLFEGDIVKDDDVTYQIRFGKWVNDEAFGGIGFYLSSIGHRVFIKDSLDPEDGSYITKLGNIYQNKDLIS